jgi:hypothetical protein
MNLIGLAAALATFLGVWLGHVTVRKIEFVSPTIWLPAALFGTVGLGLEVLALKTNSLPSSAALGILGITLLWDALEFGRQQRRIQKGHAPANPRNPRHARILAAHPQATTLNLIKIDDGP